MNRSRKKNITSNSAVTSIDGATKKHMENSWILLAQDSLLQNCEFDIVTLPHPSNNKPTKYGLDEKNKKIYEIVTFSEPHRSWFIGQAVKSNASMLMLTPVNPIFLVLPHLREQCQTRAIPLEDLLSQKGLSKIFDFVPNLINVADLKGTEDLKAYKYNEIRTLTWLKGKVRKLAKVLKDKKIHVRSGAASATFVASSASEETVAEDFFLKYALGVIAEYLEKDVKELLENSFDFQPDMIEFLGQKRKSEVGESNNKRLKGENIEKENKIDGTVAMPVSSKINQQKPLTAKEKARQKAASGTKTISAFFSKK